MIFLSGLVAAMLAYFGFYLLGSANSQSFRQSPQPELAWLKEEFHINDGEFARICQMHAEYMSGCAERCRRIDAKNQELKQLLSETNSITPEIEKSLNEAALLRANCQKQMLEHFYKVSQTMPPEQGKRYLAWVQEQTILCDSHSMMHH
jgi:hypothetical protein